MGDWYVIANIPTFIEKGAVNAIESYKLDSRGGVIEPNNGSRPNISLSHQILGEQFIIKLKLMVLKFILT